MRKSKWRKVNKYFFIYNFKNKKFLIQTYPFKIFKLSKKATESKIKNFIKDQLKKTPKMMPPGKYYLPLLIGTTNCNFKCKYCFADQGSYGEKPIKMNKKIIKATVDFLEKKMETLKEGALRKEIEVGTVFFGGEPLLHLEGLEYLTMKVKQSVKKVNTNSKVHFRPLIIVNTNGSLFTDKVLKFIKDNKDIFEIVVSFDGLHHDKYRLWRNGKPTSKIVIDGIKKIKKSGINFSLTSCIPPDETEEIDKNIKYMIRLFGKKVEINLAFIRGAIPSVQTKALYPGALQVRYSIKSLKIFGEKVASLIKRGYKIFTTKFINRIKEGGYLWRCPAALFEMCIYVDGSVYPCHNFIDKKFKLGNILNKNFNPLKNKPIINMFNSRTINRLGCKSCVFQTVCLSSFDCPSHSLYDLGGFFKVDTRTCLAAKEIMEALLEEKLLKNFLD